LCFIVGYEGKLNIYVTDTTTEICHFKSNDDYLLEYTFAELRTIIFIIFQVSLSMASRMEAKATFVALI
jgi:hypothetical protein